MYRADKNLPHRLHSADSATDLYASMRDCIGESSSLSAHDRCRCKADHRKRSDHNCHRCGCIDCIACLN